MEHFGGRLRAKRKELGLTQAALGDLIGQSKNSISLYEHNERMPSLEVLIRFAKLFGLSLDALAGLETGAALVTQKSAAFQEKNLLCLRMPDASLRSARLEKGDLLYVRLRQPVREGRIGLVQLEKEAPIVRRVYFREDTIWLEDDLRKRAYPAEFVRILGPVWYVLFTP